MKNKIKYSDFFIMYRFNIKNFISKKKISIYIGFIVLNILISSLMIFIPSEKQENIVTSIFIFNALNIIYLSVVNIIWITNIINIEKETGIYSLEKRKKIRKIDQFFSKLSGNKTITLSFITIQLLILSIIFLPFIGDYNNNNLVYKKMIPGYCASYLYDLGFTALLLLITSIFKLRTSIIIASFIGTTFILNPVLGGLMPQVFLGGKIDYLTNEYKYNKLYFNSEIQRLIKKYPDGFTKSLMDSRLEIVNDYKYISKSSALEEKEIIDKSFEYALIDLMYFSGQSFKLESIITDFIEELIKKIDNQDQIELLRSIKYEVNWSNLNNDLIFQLIYTLEQSKDKIKSKKNLNKAIINLFSKNYSKKEIKELNNLIYQWSLRNSNKFKSDRITIFNSLYIELGIENKYWKELNKNLSDDLKDNQSDTWLIQQYTFYLLELLNNVYSLDNIYSSLEEINRNKKWINSIEFGVLSILSPWTNFNMFQFYNAANKTDLLTIDIIKSSSMDLFIPIYFDNKFKNEEKIEFDKKGAYMYDAQYEDKGYELIKQEKSIYLYINYLILFLFLFISLGYGYIRY